MTLDTRTESCRRIATLMGPLWIAADEAGLTRIGFEALDVPDVESTPQTEAHLQQAIEELSEYFRGERRTFDVALAPRGTPFQQRVWAALRTIPWGQTWTYGQLAEHLGDPQAVRAVGRCNGLNPWAVVVPCHRVIGADGTLTGYAGGLERKRWLLEHEGALAPALFT